MRQVTKEEQTLWQAYMDKLTSMPALIPYRPVRRRSYVLDLHKYTVHQAFLACRDFIEQHQEQGSHYVTVITGRQGPISQEFPLWCRNWLAINKVMPIDGDERSAGSWMVYLHRR
jgi:hypothetical protein